MLENFESEKYYSYWGKSHEAEGKESNCHLLPYHCLDVAAVGKVLLEEDKRMLNRLSEIAGLPSEEFASLTTFLLSIHDIGKFADCFQALEPITQMKLQGRKREKAFKERHDLLGYLIWKQHLSDLFVDLGLLTGKAEGRRVPADYNALNQWMIAVTAHHGRPPNFKSDYIFKDYFEENDIEAALEFCKEANGLIMGKTFKKSEYLPDKIRTASWWLAGFVVICDWLGSGISHEEYVCKPVALTEYWEKAIARAKSRISESGLQPPRVSEELPNEKIFKSVDTNSLILTPLQEKAKLLKPDEGQNLFILEDVTGSGKTEAAIILAHKMMANHEAKGFYFGLPTMATANAMYERMGEVYRGLYEESEIPSLVLAHSASKLSKSFRDSLKVEIADEKEHVEEATPAGKHCNAWLADNRKKALFADIGVGTIDQALLGILPSKHQSLRLLGLLDKILVVDEVHACDIYMQELLCSLLEAHASAGGSVVLLSATLARKQRQAFLRSFSKGAGWGEVTISESGDREYPLLTQLSRKGSSSFGLDTMDRLKRRVWVELLDEKESVIEVMKKAIDEGKCACWIRNTVQDARKAFKNVKKDIPNAEVHLFHARLALCDRLEKEGEVVRMFGRKSGSAQRRGRILIATQVVEQSLDLDFDVMVSDIAPIDLLFQRSGRLQRHSRDKKGDQTGEDQRGEPRLYVFCPSASDEPTSKWLREDFKGTAKVYENQDGRLWLAQKLLRDKGGFEVPDDIREMIEAVYGEKVSEDIPEGLAEHELAAEGSDMADASIAKLNALDIDSGYSDISVNTWWDEARTPTRLGDPTTTVYLARFDGKEMEPWSRNREWQWQNSALNIRESVISREGKEESISDETIEMARNMLPCHGKWGVLLPLSEKGNWWKGNAVDANCKQTDIFYDRELGLLTERELKELEEK